MKYKELKDDWFDVLRIVYDYDKRSKPDNVLLQGRKRFNGQMFHAEIEIYNHHKEDVLDFYKGALQTHLKQYDTQS